MNQLESQERGKTKRKEESFKKKECVVDSRLSLLLRVSEDGGGRGKERVDAPTRRQGGNENECD
jgi:hypothetical protein